MRPVPRRRCYMSQSQTVWRRSIRGCWSMREAGAACSLCWIPRKTVGKCRVPVFDNTMVIARRSSSRCAVGNTSRRKIIICLWTKAINICKVRINMVIETNKIQSWRQKWKICIPLGNGDSLAQFQSLFPWPGNWPEPEWSTPWCVKWESRAGLLVGKLFRYEHVSKSSEGRLRTFLEEPSPLIDTLLLLWLGFMSHVM